MLVLHQPDEVLEAMDSLEQEHAREDRADRARARLDAHRGAGRVAWRSSSSREHVPANASPMCGNSICQDRRFLARWMPRLEAHFHYRNLDVSTLKELVRRWKPELLKGFSKEGKHEALADILESIEELKFYRKTVMTI